MPGDPGSAILARVIDPLVDYVFEYVVSERAGIDIANMGNRLVVRPTDVLERAAVRVRTAIVGARAVCIWIRISPFGPTADDHNADDHYQ